MEAAPFSLYLQLEDGSVADIEVVARSALAFSAAIKELAYVFDPSLHIRVELESGTEGSLNLNAIIRGVRARAEQRPILAAIIATSMGWFGDYSFTAIMDHLRHKDELSHQEISEIADKVTIAIQSKVAQPQVQQFFKEVQKDSAITGVGASAVAGQKPAIIIPRSEFSLRGELSVAEGLKLETHRIREKRERVVIIRPVLLHEPRRWRFASSRGEFGANIKDDQFLNDVVDGRIQLPMVGGVELDVLLEIEEEQHESIWVPLKYSILKVYDRKYPPSQPGLFAGRPQEKTDGEDK